jgi:hypothetical protein
MAAEAFNSLGGYTVGIPPASVINENGALINNSTLNPCVDAFNKLVRGITDQNLNNYVNNKNLLRCL